MLILEYNMSLGKCNNNNNNNNESCILNFICTNEKT